MREREWGFICLRLFKRRRRWRRQRGAANDAGAAQPARRIRALVANQGLIVNPTSFGCSWCIALCFVSFFSLGHILLVALLLFVFFVCFILLLICFKLVKFLLFNHLLSCLIFVCYIVCLQVLMCTNRIDILDPALLRPGRIDRKIEFPNPTESARVEILRIHSKRMNLTRNIDFKATKQKTPFVCFGLFVLVCLLLQPGCWGAAAQGERSRD